MITCIRNVSEHVEVFGKGRQDLTGRAVGTKESEREALLVTYLTPDPD